MNSRACLDINHPGSVAAALRAKVARAGSAMGFHLEGVAFVVAGRDRLEVVLRPSIPLPQPFQELVTTYITNGRVVSSKDLVGNYASASATARIRRVRNTANFYYVEVAAPTRLAAEEFYQEIARGNSERYRKSA